MSRPTILIAGGPPGRWGNAIEALETAGYDVLRAYSEAMAMDLDSSRSVDVVLIDLSLPEDLDGFQFLGLLRSLPGGAERTILGLVGVQSGHDQQLLLQTDFTDYLYTPLEPQRLLRLLGVYLQPELMTDREAH